jgi:hypothetical protein
MSMLAWERAASTFPQAPNGVTFRAFRRERSLEIGVHIPDSAILAKFTIEHFSRALHGTWAIRIVAKPDVNGLPANLWRDLKTLETGWLSFLEANPNLQGAKAWRSPFLEGKYEQQ